MRKIKNRKAARSSLFATPVEILEPRQLLAAHIANNPTVYATIQAAVDAAAPGATITVDAGEYDELVTITKTLTLRGAQAGIDAQSAARSNPAAESVVRGQVLGSGDRSTGFYINANNVVLDGFTVQDDSSANFYGAGIVLAPNVSGTHVVNNIVQDNVAGLYLSSSSATVQTLIQHNVFASNNNAGQNSGRGIYSDGGVSGGNLTNVLIDSNTFTANTGNPKIQAAIDLETQAAGEQSHITISNNTMKNNGKAVLMVNSTDVTISGNTITGSTDTGSAALRFEGGMSDMTITGNTLKNNLNAGVRIDNNFSTGVNTDIKITGNNFITNAQGGIKVDAGTYVGTLDATHNYWGSASGPSGDGKGTGDAILANGNSVTFDPWSTTAINPTQPPPPPPPPPPTPPPPPPPAPPPPPTGGGTHHKPHKPVKHCPPHHKPKHLTHHQLLEELLKKLKALKKKKAAHKKA